MLRAVTASPNTALVVAALTLALASSVAKAEYFLLLDPTRFNAAEATRGAGPDGRIVRPSAVVAACLRDGVLTQAAFAPALDRCRAVAAIAGLAEMVAELPVAGADSDITVRDLVNAGGIVAVASRRRLACRPGACSRELFDDASYPENLVGRPQPPPLPVPSIQDFDVQPTTLTAGDTAVLSWNAIGANRCRLESSQSQAFLEVQATGMLSLEPSEDTVWTLTCAVPGDNDTAQVTVSVDPPPDAPEILLFEARRDDVPVGERAELLWASRQATDCTLSDGDAAIPVPVNGRRAIPINETTRFNLACVNPSGSANAAAQVQVTTADQAPLIELFELDRNIIARGDGLIARWRAPGASECRLRDPEQGATWRLSEEGQFRLAPAVNTQYTLACRNARGGGFETRTVSITESDEPLRVLSFGLTPFDDQPRGTADGTLTLPGPGLVRLTWTTQAASACRIVNDDGQAISVPVNGSRVIGIDQPLGLQLQCSSRQAEAQALRQVRVRSEALFSDRFER